MNLGDLAEPPTRAPSDPSVRVYDTDPPVQDTDLPVQDTDLPVYDTDLPVYDMEKGDLSRLFGFWAALDRARRRRARLKRRLFSLGDSASRGRLGS